MIEIVIKLPKILIDNNDNIIVIKISVYVTCDVFEQYS